MPLNAAELVTVKGDVNLTHVQIYPGMGSYGQPWRFAMVCIFYFYSTLSSILFSNCRKLQYL